jgi:hypothetical protein
LSQTVGTQSALLTGFAFAAIIEGREFDGFTESQLALQSVWYIVTVLAMALEVTALIKSMQLSIMAPGLALRGPEGSMTRALVAMRHEFKRVHHLFYGGLVTFLISVGLYGWALLAELVHGAMAIGSTMLVILTLVFLVYDYRSLNRKLSLPAHVVKGEWEPEDGSLLGPVATTSAGGVAQHAATATSGVGAASSSTPSSATRPGWLSRSVSSLSARLPSPRRHSKRSASRCVPPSV